MKPIRLYMDTFWISPYALTPFVVLREKGISLEVIPVALHMGEQKASRFRDASLTAKVPAIEHDGFWLSESMAIVDYLEEAFPAPQHKALLPKEVQPRARARQIMSWLRTDLVALREERSTRTVFYDHTREPLSPAATESRDKLLRITQALLPAANEFLFGEFSAPDADLGMMLQRLVANGDDVPERVRRYANAVWNRPSVKEFVDQKRPPFIPYT